MKKFLPFLVTGIVAVGAVACQEETRTGSEVPGETNEAVSPSAKEASETAQTPTDESAAVPGTELNQDPTAPLGAGTDTAETEISSAVNQKLSEALPTSNLKAEDVEGVVTIKGTVPSSEELQQIEPLTKEVKGVKGVNIEANVDAAPNAAPDVVPDAVPDAAPDAAPNPQ